MLCKDEPGSTHIEQEPKNILVNYFSFSIHNIMFSENTNSLTTYLPFFFLPNCCGEDFYDYINSSGK